MFKKILAVAFCVSCLGTTSASAADEYKKCLDENYMSDYGMTTCNNQEYDRKFQVAKKIIKQLAGSPYYQGWVSGNIGPEKQADDLISQWERYINYFCNFYGYVFTQGEGTIYQLQMAQCRVNEVNYLIDRLNFIKKVYDQN